MERQSTWLFPTILPWMSVMFLTSTCSGMNAPQLQLESRVFVAFKGEDLTIGSVVWKAANLSTDLLTCSGPNRIWTYSVKIPPTADREQKFTQKLQLKNVTISGEYYCQYITVQKFWFLRMRDEGYKEPSLPAYTELTIMAIVTGMLLVFSVVGSLYVFRGHLRICQCKDSDKKIELEKRKQENPEEEENNKDVMKAQSSSFYGSLEPRPRSIYDVLDCPNAKAEPKKNKSKSKKNEPRRMVEPNAAQSDEGVLESVYENF